VLLISLSASTSTKKERIYIKGMPFNRGTAGVWWSPRYIDVARGPRRPDPSGMTDGGKGASRPPGKLNVKTGPL